MEYWWLARRYLIMRCVPISLMNFVVTLILILERYVFANAKSKLFDRLPQ